MIEDNIKAISEMLIELFPDNDYDTGREVGRGLYSFYVTLNNREQYILKLSDECISDHSMQELAPIVEGVVKEALVVNPNKVVLLTTDLSVTIRDVEE